MRVSLSFSLFSLVVGAQWSSRPPARRQGNPGKWSEPLVSPEAVMVACTDATNPHIHQVKAIEPASGQERWTGIVRSMSEQPYMWGPDWSVVSLDEWDEDMKPNKTVVARDPLEGSELWRHKVDQSCGYGFLMGTTADTYYLLCNADPANFTLDTIHSYEMSSGALRWKMSFENESIGTFWDRGDGVMYVLSDSCGPYPPRTTDFPPCGNLHAMHVGPSFQSKKWSYSIGAPGWNLGGASDMGEIFITAQDGSLHKLNTEDGTAVWVVKAPEPDEPTKWYPYTPWPSVGASTVSSDGSMLFVFETHGLLAVNKSTGETAYRSAEAVGRGDPQCASIGYPVLSNHGDQVFGLHAEISNGRNYSHPQVVSVHAADGHFGAASPKEFEGPCASVSGVSGDDSLVFATVQFGNYYLHAFSTSDMTSAWEFKCPELATMMV